MIFYSFQSCGTLFHMMCMVAVCLSPSLYLTANLYYPKVPTQSICVYLSKESLIHWEKKDTIVYAPNVKYKEDLKLKTKGRIKNQ